LRQLSSGSTFFWALWLCTSSAWRIFCLEGKFVPRSGRANSWSRMRDNLSPWPHETVTVSCKGTKERYRDKGSTGRRSLRDWTWSWLSPCNEMTTVSTPIHCC
jgi:hypothetical protein